MTEMGEDSVDGSHVLNRLGALYLDTNRLKEAEAAFKKTLTIRQAKLGPSHSRVGQTLKRTCPLSLLHWSLTGSYV